MTRFEISDDASETLLLVYPPEAIRELNAILDRIERANGELPEIMRTPVKGRFKVDAAQVPA